MIISPKFWHQSTLNCHIKTNHLDLYLNVEKERQNECHIKPHLQTHLGSTHTLMILPEALTDAKCELLADNMMIYAL